MPVHALAKAPAGDALKLKPIRIGLYDSYGGSMPSGWTRWLFEQYEMPFQMVYPATLDAGDLKSKFDVMVFVTGDAQRRRWCAGVAGGGGRGGGRRRRTRRRMPRCPTEYSAMQGRISEDKLPFRSSRNSWNWAEPSSPSAAAPTLRRRTSACP